MPIIRRKLDPNTVYPTNLRYDADTDAVQSFVNGEWVDNPAADPRTQTTIPARVTSNTRCDAAASVSDALQNQLNQATEATANASTAFTIAGIILSLFTFGTFGVFISIALTAADAMISAGSAALEAALTPAVFDTLTCILSCHFDNSGRLKSGGLSDAMGEITDMIGGLGASTINSMLALAGEGGVNNLAALGTASGDCSECDECPEEWCFNFDFALSDGGWTVVDGQVGVWNAGFGWNAVTSFNYRLLGIELDFDSTEITGVDIIFSLVLDTRTITPFGDKDSVHLNSSLILEEAVLIPPTSPWQWSGDEPSRTNINLLMICGVVAPENAPAGGDLNISSIKIRGLGECPFGTPNCE